MEQSADFVRCALAGGIIERRAMGCRWVVTKQRFTFLGEDGEGVAPFRNVRLLICAEEVGNVTELVWQGTEPIRKVPEALLYALDRLLPGCIEHVRHHFPAWVRQRSQPSLREIG
jgi:hypothetical protein